MTSVVLGAQGVAFHINLCQHVKHATKKLPVRPCPSQCPPPELGPPFDPKGCRYDQTMAAPDLGPPFDPKGCRYDQKTYAGRLRRFKDLTDPRMLLIGDEELSKAQALLGEHAKGKASGATDAELWHAQRVKDAIIHPVTGEKMFLPGRMSAFVPINTPVTVGMLLAKTPAQTIFWQWVNQSCNVMCNYVNRSGAAVDTAQVAQAYGLAVGVSCSIALGARRLVEAGPPWVKRLSIAVPYAAVVSAGASNLAFTRLPEMQAGVPVAAPDGTPLGTSKAAARSAVASTVISRIVLQPIVPMLLPPLLSAAMRTVMPLGPIAQVASQTAFVAGCSAFALPVAIAVFPQEMKIATSALEPEFQHAKDAKGQPIEYVLCNKGL